MTTGRSLASILLATSMLAGTSAYAQAPAPAPAADDGGDEIIVTAQKREESLQNVPISIQAIGTRKLDQLNISNFNE